MKRDWELLREQLSAIEEEKDFLSGFPGEPKWLDDQSEAEYLEELKKYRTAENRVFGHLELLIDNGYVEGIEVTRGSGGEFFYSEHSPRLTMAGHDLLDTMRSTPIWESIKSTAKTKGIELTFDAIKSLGALALKQMFM